ncbi:hypothetical protein T36_1655 [Helicobacter cinaedi]|nr:hypothetical protein T36_1655 [Helicobacter cinaedi]
MQTIISLRLLKIDRLPEESDKILTMIKRGI